MGFQELMAIRFIELFVHLTDLLEGMSDQFRVLCYLLVELFDLLRAVISVCAHYLPIETYIVL